MGEGFRYTGLFLSSRWTCRAESTRTQREAVGTRRKVGERQCRHNSTHFALHNFVQRQDGTGASKVVRRARGSGELLVGWSRRRPSEDSVDPSEEGRSGVWGFLPGVQLQVSSTPPLRLSPDVAVPPSLVLPFVTAKSGRKSLTDPFHSCKQVGMMPFEKHSRSTSRQPPLTQCRPPLEPFPRRGCRRASRNPHPHLLAPASRPKTGPGGDSGGG